MFAIISLCTDKCVQINYYTLMFEEITSRKHYYGYPHIIYVTNDNSIGKQNAYYSSMCLYPDFENDYTDNVC